MNPVQQIITKALNRAARVVLLRTVGLSYPTFLNWFLPWRARKWQLQATEVITDLLTKLAPTSQSRHPQPFPWSCSKCRKSEVYPTTIEHTALVKHEEQLHSVHIPDLPVLQCRSCGNILTENISHDRILQALHLQIRPTETDQ